MSSLSFWRYVTRDTDDNKECEGRCERQCGRHEESKQSAVDEAIDILLRDFTTSETLSLLEAMTVFIGRFDDIKREAVEWAKRNQEDDDDR